MKILVLGAGLVGGPMAMDLARDGEFEVTSADISAEALLKLRGFPGIQTIKADLGDLPELVALANGFDLVVSAVPGHMGYRTLETLIECRKNVVDIAFFPEDMFGLDEKARAMGVTVICDMGVAPGMSNVLLGYGASMLDHLEKGIIYVGGLPVVRTWPYEYKAVFSPIDVIEEYTRPARYIDGGRLVVREALSDPELIDFPGIGTLEAFNSDGLRTLATTLKGDYMIEKTLRYKGHIEKMAVLRDTGFFSKEPLNINGTLISPLEFTSRLLFPKWKLEPGEEDLTVMQVITEGIKDGVRQRYTWNLYDRYDSASGIHSMARTTGYAATMAARLIAGGLYQEKGVSAPEFLGRNPVFVNYLLEGLRRRGVVYRENREMMG
ncbi:saccharopine dehydrogenase C-terminal domain-containing protein [Lentimicrobium sp.]|uniref:saccharopine dehydrogenase family protein n=1 Tax=Lentimicrobium sp. TaxID=2034841 RepID=UPI002B63C20D|nr:saccharopine dehydrogenase C-terminal domain-containing protein [Lentimicrobium sp.]HPJ62872.1 saccharopine dehydrogenase C-terminal domain-containing protein [Lentimicrobium sp.]HRW69211.1 saccharopine dehydrogenase C-terminal domain-containing protein [Lentimicrobium sp.]